MGVKRLRTVPQQLSRWFFLSPTKAGLSSNCSISWYQPFPPGGAVDKAAFSKAAFCACLGDLQSRERT